MAKQQPIHPSKLRVVVFLLPVLCLAFQWPVNAQELTDSPSKPVAQAAAENEPQRGTPETKEQTDLDPATRLGRATHERMSAIDHLPKFFVTSSNVGFERFYLEDPSDDFLDNLIRSLDLGIGDKRFGRRHDEFGWDEDHFLRASGDNEKELQSYWGSREIAGRISESARDLEKPRGRPTVYRDAQHAWASMGDLASNYMRASPHTFWFGSSQRYRSFTRNITPANITNYERLADMKFDGELCQVVRSTARQEMLIISKASGLLRGYAVIRHKPSVTPFFNIDKFQNWANSDKSEIAFDLRNSLKDITGVDFSTKLNYFEWYRKNEVNLSIQQKQQLEVAVMLSLDWSRPLAAILMRFRDYREIAPGIMWPFREDYVRARGFDQAGRFISERTSSDVKEIRVDMDLTGRINALRPKQDEEVADYRFQTILNYKFSQDRTNEEIMKMVEVAFAKKMKDPQYTEWPKKALNDLLNKPAPILPTKDWVGGERPIVDGEPYLLHFWATWYGPCKNDFPILKQLTEAGATVVGAVPFGTSPDEVSEAMKVANLPYPTYILPNEGSGIRHLDGHPSIVNYPSGLFPYCVLVDGKGNVVAHGELAENGYAILEKFSSLIKTADPEFKWEVPKP